MYTLLLTWTLCHPVNATQAYPERPVHVIVGGGPGSGIDLVMRAVAETFEKRTGQKMVIDNRPGGLGRIAAYATRDAVADGYTLGTITPGTLEAMRVNNDTEGYKRLDFLLGVATFPLLIVTKRGAASSLSQLIANKPREYGHSNSIGKIGAEIFLDAARVEPRPHSVYYTGKEPAMFGDLLGGRIAFAVAIAPAVRGNIEGGALNALAVVAQTRAPFLPLVPTLAEELATAGIHSVRPAREPALGIVVPIGIDSGKRHQVVRLLREAMDAPLTQSAIAKLWAGPTVWDQESYRTYATE